MATEYGSEFPEYIITGALSDGSNIDAVLDYSATPATFEWHPDPDRDLAWITALIIWIEGDGPVRLDTYGTLSELTNGLTLSIEGPSGTIWQSGVYKRNGDWNIAAQEMQVQSALGVHKGVKFVLTMENFSTHPMPVEIGNWVQVLVNDDFSTLFQHRFYIRGGYATS